MDQILKRFKLLLETLLATLLLLTGLIIFPAWAAEAPIEIEKIELPARPGLDTNAISSEKISQFVQSYLQVVALINQREGELQGAETESDSFRIKQEIETEAKTLIETAGLNFQEYIQLLTLANIDTEFSERIAAQLQEAMD
jgi:Domain of unknown function (DUF4168)